MLKKLMCVVVVIVSVILGYIIGYNDNLVKEIIYLNKCIEFRDDIINAQNDAIGVATAIFINEELNDSIWVKACAKIDSLYYTQL